MKCYIIYVLHVESYEDYRLIKKPENVLLSIGGGRGTRGIVHFKQVSMNIIICLVYTEIIKNIVVEPPRKGSLSL